MKKMIKMGSIFAIALIVLTGCFESNGQSASNKPTEKEITLYREQKLTNQERYSGIYYFNGFSGEDTLSFTDRSEMGNVVVYQQAKIGLTFKLNEIENYEFEIIDFNRAENYVKLKLRRIQMPENNEGKSDK